MTAQLPLPQTAIADVATNAGVGHGCLARWFADLLCPGDPVGEHRCSRNSSEHRSHICGCNATAFPTQSEPVRSHSTNRSHSYGSADR